MAQQIAALYVETNGAYFGLPDVDPWDVARDARSYPGPPPVVAHPPCQRWGRFWHGSTRKPHQFKMGDDGGCFDAALDSLLQFGGVLEHPADSHAWAHHHIAKPPRSGCWVPADLGPLTWTCCVYQGKYGHPAGKPTWLLAVGVPGERLPEMLWGKTEQRLSARARWSSTATRRRGASESWR